MGAAGGTSSSSDQNQRRSRGQGMPPADSDQHVEAMRQQEQRSRASQSLQSSQPTAAAAAVTRPSAGTVASEPAGHEPRMTYSRGLVSSLRPTVGAYTPQLEHFKKALMYVTEAAVEYEEFHGSPSFKSAGLKDPPSTSSSKPKKPVGRSKAAQAAHANQQVFSQDPQIHEMEDTLNSILEIQHMIEAERLALDNLSATISMGTPLPAKDLQTSFEHLVKSMTKNQQVLLKRESQKQMEDFRTKVWDVHHEGTPFPKGAAGAGGEDEDEDSMEIVVQGGLGTQSLKCPITTNFLEDPVTSTSCKHSFSKEAILTLIRSNSRSFSVCPVHGCNRPITVDMLQPNKSLARKVARQIMIQQDISQYEEEEYTTVD